LPVIRQREDLQKAGIPAEGALFPRQFFSQGFSFAKEKAFPKLFAQAKKGLPDAPAKV